MHDFFDVIGLPSNAPIGEIRRCARRTRRLHPDFRVGVTAVPAHAAPETVVPRDVAVDFVDVATLFDRIESAFFGHGA